MRNKVLDLPVFGGRFKKIRLTAFRR